MNDAPTVEDFELDVHKMVRGVARLIERMNDSKNADRKTLRAHLQKIKIQAKTYSLELILTCDEKETGGWHVYLGDD